MTASKKSQVLKKPIFTKVNFTKMNFTASGSINIIIDSELEDSINMKDSMVILKKSIKMKLKKDCGTRALSKEQKRIKMNLVTTLTPLERRK